MSGTLKLSGALKVGSLATAPSNPEVGFQYYDSTLNIYRRWNGSQWVEDADLAKLASQANGEGASLIGIEDAAGQFTGTTVEAGLTESMDAAQAAQGSLDGHLDGGTNKHDATEIDIEAADGKNHSVGNLEAVVGQLDDAIGTLTQGSNYTAASPTEVGSHLDAIDSALVTAGSTEFADDEFRVTGSVDASKKVAIEVDGITTATTRTITMPDADVDLGDIATNNAKISADGSVTTHNDVTSAGSGIIISGVERTKLDGIEASADVTDSVNVDAAGAVMESDTSTSSMSFVIDEDSMASDSPTKVPTQQSVKAYVDASVVGGVSYKGSYDASTNTPDLDTAPVAGTILTGDMYTVTAVGTFYSVDVEVGDVLIAEIDDAATEADWTIVNKNLDAASIKTAYESNGDTNAFTDAEQTKVANLSGTNTGDEVAATETVAGISELATIAEIDTGSDNTRTITPAGLAGSALQSSVDGHLDGGVNKHDASEIDVEAADGKNHAAGDLESVVGELDDAIGTLNQGANYTAANAAEIGSHLDAIDDALADSGSVITKLQVAHGFAQFDAIYHNGTIWVKSIATSANTLTEYIVSEVVDVDNFKAAKWGQVDATAHGKTVGEHYYLSETVAGAGVTVEPDVYSSPLYYVEDANTIQLEVYRPSVDITSDVFDDASFKVVDAAGDSLGMQFDVSAVTTADKIITMPDADVDLGDIATNSAKVSADGSVTSHSDVTDAGSGIIISGAERTKLNGIEALATADQTGAEIKIAYEAELDTNAFDDAAVSKLAGIEAFATADQTGAEIKIAYEAEADTNAFDDAAVSKLGGIEALADVTDSTNVEAAGAVMEGDTTTASMSFVIDEDDMISNLDTKVPTQQSVKTYIDNVVSSGVSYKGGYDAALDLPSLDSAPNTDIAVGDMYTVTVAGVFYTINVEVGDVLIAEAINPTVESDWTVVNKNLDAASIKTSYESNADTNAYTDADALVVSNLSGTNTGDEVAATDTVAGIVELATLAEVDAGIDTVRAVTPASLATIQTDVDANTAKVGYTAALAKADVVNDSITDGNLDTAPSENAVFDALALKLANVSEDTTPSLGGDLTLGSNVVIHDADGMKRGSSASDFLEEEYIHAIALSGSQTNVVIASLTFAHASFEGMEMTYKLKEATSGDVRIGTLRICTNGTLVDSSDMFNETADTGITFSVAINGANVEIKYTSGVNGATLRADVKRIKA